MRQFSKAFRNVEERAAVVIGSFPNAAFVESCGLVVGTDHEVQAMKFGIDLIFLDEIPLLLECFEIQIGFRAVFFVHQQQRIQSFDLHPPFLAFVFGRTVGGAILVEAAEIGVPAVGQGVVHEHFGHALGGGIVVWPRAAEVSSMR